MMHRCTWRQAGLIAALLTVAGLSGVGMGGEIFSPGSLRPPGKAQPPPQPPAEQLLLALPEEIVTSRAVTPLPEMAAPQPLLETVEPLPAAPPPRRYDPLPLRFADMSPVDRIALEPYPQYEALPLIEKAGIYARQFKAMHDRAPHFSPETVAAIRRSRDRGTGEAQDEVDELAQYSGMATHYDELPRRRADMNPYERIAMEPYANYDALPLLEKARLYARQFEAMHDRKPVYSPETIADLRKSRGSMYENIKDHYKAVPDAQSAPGMPPAPLSASSRSEVKDTRMDNLRTGRVARDNVRNTQ